MGVIARILIRYATGPFILLGWLLPDEQAELIMDPDVLHWVTTVIGLLVMVATEYYWRLAKRFGWST